MTGGGDLAELLDVSGTLDTAAALAYQLARDAYERGRADGWAEGRAALLGEQEAAERTLCQRLMPTLMAPDFAELERRRYGPGGRAHFGDPRPGDYIPETTQPRERAA